MTSAQTNDILKFFESYCDFYFVENQVALIDGRANEIVLLYLKELEKILFQHSISNLDNVKSASNIYVEECKIDYGTHGYGTNCIFPDTVTDQNIIRAFEDNDDELQTFFRLFFDAYELLSLAFTDDTHEILLVEFNNTLAHLLIALSKPTNGNFDKNISRAKAHLFRGSLDAYKEIIAYEVYRDDRENYYIDPEIKKRLFTLRLEEITGVGASVSGKESIIEEYARIANELINTTIPPE
ncbi:MAG: hypothetical protein U9Q33_04320 [Campylobacterota bacterium]|nr:hypothetical protein [Campylobacterota bacterium]